MRCRNTDEFVSDYVRPPDARHGGLPAGVGVPNRRDRHDLACLPLRIRVGDGAPERALSKRRGGLDRDY
jgi:hypothetical protein